jgi:hypothetical protein
MVFTNSKQLSSSSNSVCIPGLLGAWSDANNLRLWHQASPKTHTAQQRWLLVSLTTNAAYGCKEWLQTSHKRRKPRGVTKGILSQACTAMAKAWKILEKYHGCVHCVRPHTRTTSHTVSTMCYVRVKIDGPAKYRIYFVLVTIDGSVQITDSTIYNVRVNKDGSAHLLNLQSTMCVWI